MVGYSFSFKEKETYAKAIGKELHVSPKHSIEICRQLRGKKVEKAKEYLEDVIALKRAVPFKKYERHIGHKRGKGFGAGRYPQKAAKAILKVLETAEANAEYSGMETEDLKILHIAANRGRIIHGWMPRAHGRSDAKDTETVNIEIVLKEVES